MQQENLLEYSLVREQQHLQQYTGQVQRRKVQVQSCWTEQKYMLNSYVFFSFFFPDFCGISSAFSKFKSEKLKTPNISPRGIADAKTARHQLKQHLGEKWVSWTKSPQNSCKAYRINMLRSAFSVLDWGVFHHQCDEGKYLLCARTWHFEISPYKFFPIQRATLSSSKILSFMFKLEWWGLWTEKTNTNC